MKISEYILGYRDKWNMSKTALAEDLGVSITTITYWEDNKGLPTETTRKYLTDYFGIDFSRVFELYDNNDNYLTTGTDRDLADYLGVGIASVRRQLRLRSTGSFAGYWKKEIEWCSENAEVAE